MSNNFFYFLIETTEKIVHRISKYVLWNESSTEAFYTEKFRENCFRNTKQLREQQW